MGYFYDFGFSQEKHFESRMFLGVHESNPFFFCVSIRKGGVSQKFLGEPFKKPEASFQQNRPFPVDSSRDRTWSLNLEVTKSQPKLTNSPRGHQQKPPIHSIHQRHKHLEKLRPMEPARCNCDMEPLLSDQNRNTATLALTTLLKTGRAGHRSNWDRVDRCWLDRNLRNLDRWPQIQGSLFFGKQLVTCMNCWGLPSKTPAGEMIHSWSFMILVPGTFKI